MSLSLKGKTALVTGSSRGIGRAIAERLAADGATVVINFTSQKKAAEELVKRIADHGGKAVAIKADLAKTLDVRRLFDEAEKAVGRLDIVVANAAVFIGKPLVESTEEDYDYVFNVNTRGVFFTLQEAARRVRDGGRIIVVSSGGTKIFFGNASLYIGSKGAIEQFARALSREIGHRKVTVNILSPGYTETDMLNNAAGELGADQIRGEGARQSPFNRIGTSEEVAEVAGFLASDAARWLTGQNVQAGGGVV
jgi:3-oxoacyl-[acyl-carrier protein] reductase